MKLNEFIANLLIIVENNPELAESEVITMSMDGQLFNKVAGYELGTIQNKTGLFQIGRGATIENANAIIIN